MNDCIYNTGGFCYQYGMECPYIGIEEECEGNQQE